MAVAVGGLDNRRPGYIRHLMQRVNSVAKRLEPTYAPFDATTGWFGGKGFDDIDSLIRTTRSARYAPPSALIDKIVSWSSLGITGVQILELMNGWRLIDIPFLKENLHDVVSGIPIDGMGDFANQMGALGDVGVADVLGDVIGVYSVGKIFYNLHEAGEIRTASAHLVDQIDEIRRKSRQLSKVTRRAEEISVGLSATSYIVFKWAWTTEQLLKEHSGPFSATERRIINLFERAARKFWSYLNMPIAEKGGYT
jgi:hypothetical protein